MAKKRSHVTANVLRTTARRMLPFYKKIVCNRIYAKRWSRAVVKTDLAKMERMLNRVSPGTGKDGLGSNGIGYFVSFAFRRPNLLYSNGTTIVPGTARFVFQTRVHRRIALAVLPLYRNLAFNKLYAESLARAIRRGDEAIVRRLIRASVRSCALRSVRLQDDGVSLSFRYAFSRYEYRNVLFRDF